MKQQTTALLLSALLLSTFATELRMKTRYAPQKKKTRNLEAESTTDASGTTALTGTTDNPTCQWVCTSDNKTSPDSHNGNLTVIILGKGSLIAVYEPQIKVAIVFGVDFVALLDGSTGDVALVSTNNSTGIFIAGGKCQHGWRASEKNLKDYLQSFSFLGFYKTYKIGVNATSLNTTEASQFLLRISNTLGIRFKNSAFAVILELSVSIGKVIRSGVLSLFLIKSTFTIVAISRDLGIKGLISRFEGVQIITANCTEAEIKGLNGTLDLRIFVTIRTGADLFVYVYSKISRTLAHISFFTFISIVAKFETSEYFRLLLQWVSVLVELVQSGGKNHCIFEKFSKLSILVSLLKKEVRYSFKEQLKNILSTLRRIPGLKNLCNDSKCEQLKINGVNIIRIISLLWSNSEDRLFFIVTVLLNLEVLKNDVAINMFFLFLFKLLISRDGIALYLSIIPDSNVSQVLNSNSNITVEFSKSILVILIGLSHGDISLLLKSQFNILWKQFDEAIAHVTKNKKTFKDTLSSIASTSLTIEVIHILILKFRGLLGSNGSSGGDGGSNSGESNNEEGNDGKNDGSNGSGGGDGGSNSGGSNNGEGNDGGANGGKNDDGSGNGGGANGGEGNGGGVNGGGGNGGAGNGGEGNGGGGNGGRGNGEGGNRGDNNGHHGKGHNEGGHGEGSEEAGKNWGSNNGKDGGKDNHGEDSRETVKGNNNEDSGRNGNNGIGAGAGVSHGGTAVVKTRNGVTVNSYNGKDYGKQKHQTKQHRKT